MDRGWRPLARLPRDAFRQWKGPVKLEAAAGAERSPSKACMAAQKKFSEFCGSSREVPARSPPEDPRLLTTPSLRASDLNPGRGLFVFNFEILRANARGNGPQTAQGFKPLPPAPARGRHREFRRKRFKTLLPANATCEPRVACCPRYHRRCEPADSSRSRCGTYAV